MSDKKMTDDQVFAVAATSDLLREFGYESVADVLSSISEQEIVLQYKKLPRNDFPVVEFDKLIGVAKYLVDSTDGNESIKVALRALLATFRPDERDQITDYLNK